MGFPADAPLWEVVIGDPGPDLLFDNAVYVRGALTLQALRMKVGDRAFFTILKRWAREHSGGLVTTWQFKRLAEDVSGQQLDGFFRTWLFTPRKPKLKGYDLARVLFTTPTPSTQKLVSSARR